ncbi:MAG: hypothetical protein ABI725_00250 [Chloroflexota bacterium]
MVGSNPQTIRVRAWADGPPEPAGWQFTATRTTSVLQAAGEAGLRLYVDAGLSNAPVILGFDDL